MTLALGVLPRHTLCDDLSGLMGLEVALHLPHISLTAAPLPPPPMPAVHTELGGLHLGLSSGAPHNWAFLLSQTNGPVLEPVSLTQ